MVVFTSMPCNNLSRYITGILENKVCITLNVNTQRQNIQCVLNYMFPKSAMRTYRIMP